MIMSKAMLEVYNCLLHLEMNALGGGLAIACLEYGVLRQLLDWTNTMTDERYVPTYYYHYTTNCIYKSF